MADKFSGPSDEDKKRKIDSSSLKQLLGIYTFIKPYNGYFTFGMICLFFSSSVLLGFPKIAGALLDAAQGKASFMGMTDISKIALLLMAVLVLQSAFSFGRVWFFSQVSERAMADMRTALYQKLMTVPLPFFDKQRTGELMSRITNDVTTLQDVFSVTLAEFIRQILTLVFGLGILFYEVPKLTFFMLGTIPVLVISAVIFGRFIRKLSKERQDELALSNVIVEETLQAISIVKAFTNELFELNRYAASQKKVVGISLRYAAFRGAFISFILFAMFGGITLVLWYGAGLMQEGSITSGGLTSFILYTMFIGGSIAGLGDIYSTLQRAVGATERIRELLAQTGEQEITADQADKRQKVFGEIELKDVRFSYPARQDVEVLKGISFKIKAGNKIALVGQSGAGKSTIAHLLLRFYDHSSGKILLDGKEINGYDLYAYRHNIAVVPQEIILFGGTIRENIAYGKPEASDAEIIEAAQKANAWGFIEKFPEGMATVVGERGIQLSGGQKQRVAIARAILKDPKILILDEATSSLDAESEKLVQDALDKLMEGRTTVIIAHRLATIRKADKIYVLENGLISESGTHEELATVNDGIYNKLIKLQFEVNY